MCNLIRLAHNKYSRVFRKKETFSITHRHRHTRRKKEGSATEEPASHHSNTFLSPSPSQRECIRFFAKRAKRDEFPCPHACSLRRISSEGVAQFILSFSSSFLFHSLSLSLIWHNHTRILPSIPYHAAYIYCALEIPAPRANNTTRASVNNTTHTTCAPPLVQSSRIQVARHLENKSKQPTQIQYEADRFRGITILLFCLNRRNLPFVVSKFA